MGIPFLLGGRLEGAVLAACLEEANPIHIVFLDPGMWLSVLGYWENQI